MTAFAPFAVLFDWSLFQHRIVSPGSAFWGALATTVYVAVIAQTLGTGLGALSALAGMSRRRPLRIVSGIYVLVFRGTPLIVQIFFTYFGANLLLGVELFPRSLGLGGVSISGAVLAGMVALAVNEGAYMSEIVRAGIAAIDHGHVDAAKSVGMTYTQTLRHVVLPQAARIIVPPLGNELNNMLKNTSLLAFIGVYEMFQDAEVGYSKSFQPVEYFVGVACWYLLLTTIWSVVQTQIERKLGASERDTDESWVARLFGREKTLAWSGR
jgi:polar amino acid transport system permease protein